MRWYGIMAEFWFLLAPLTVVTALSVAKTTGPLSQVRQDRNEAAAGRGNAAVTPGSLIHSALMTAEGNMKLTSIRKGSTEEGTRRGKYNDDDSRRRRNDDDSRRRRNKDTIKVEFGGDRRSGEVQEGDVGRPELVKSLLCRSSKDSDCEECEDKSQCWKGVNAQDWEGGSMNPVDSFLDIDLEAAVDPFTHFMADASITCASQGGRVWVRAVHSEDKQLMLENGVISVFIDGKHAGTLDTENTLYKHDMEPFQKKTLRLVFQPSGYPARARVEFDVDDVSKDTSDCMDAKKCLQMFADGSDEGYQLRNENKLQLHCLKGRRDKLTHVQKRLCDDWLECLADEDKDNLEIFLSVALSAQKNRRRRRRKKWGSLSQVQHHAWNGVVENATSEFTECMNPAVDDPEALECDCLAKTLERCRAKHGANLDASKKEACLNDDLCESAFVCQEWRDDHCGDSSLEVGLKSRVEKEWVASKGGLDNSLHGKCSG